MLKRVRVVLSVLSVLSVSMLSLVACVAELDQQGPASAAPTTASEAPLIGVEGAGDFADRACQIVLHDAGRVARGSGFATVDNSSSWLFDARVDVASAALAEGFSPMLLVRSGSDAGWRAVAPTASTSMPNAVDRFLFMIDSGNLPGPGLSGTGLSRATVSMIPFLTRGDARLFDHNRIVDAFAVYELTVANTFAVAADDAVCAPPAGPTLHFGADWSVTQTGPVEAGKSVIVDYDLTRLPECRTGYAGRAAWNIEAVALFTPMNVQQAATVLDTSASTSSTWVGKPATFQVPAGATGMQLWFHNTDRGGCNRYDSNFNRNYRFDVVSDVGAAPAPTWMGNVTAVLSRGASRRCEGATAFGSTLAFGTWARQRAAITDLCFEVYQPGLTDRDNPDLWRQLDVKVEARYRGASQGTTMFLPIIDRVGNNARYAVDLRAFDPFIWGRCLNGVPTTTVEENGQAMLQATAELVLTVNGHPLRPQGGDAFRVVYSDASSAPRVSCE